MPSRFRAEMPFSQISKRSISNPLRPIFSIILPDSPRRKKSPKPSDFQIFCTFVFHLTPRKVVERIRQFPQLFLFLILLSFYSCHAPKSSTFFLGGIQVNEPDHNDWVSVLEDVGMNTVSVTVYVRQAAWNNSNIWWNEEDIKVVDEIRAAKKKGMKVVLIPRILLDHYFEENAFLWHGMIQAQTEEQLEEWFKSYTTFVNFWAEICEAEGVDVMAIGSEMRILSATSPVDAIPELESYYLNPEKQSAYIADRMAFSSQIPADDLWVRGKEVNYQSLEKYLQDEVATKISWAQEVAFANAPDPIAAINQRRSFKLQLWYQLIAEVRQSYSGQLTYAANFDNYQSVHFWDALDFIGINAYFKLREYRPEKNEQQQFEEVQESWDTIFSDLQTFRLQDSLEQKVIFTELGYIYRKNCTVMPWEGFGFSIAEVEDKKNLLIWAQQEPDLQERAMAVKALHQSNKRYNLLEGILYWKFTTKEYHIPYEPFVLHLKKEDPDPMQLELLKFLK